MTEREICECCGRAFPAREVQRTALGARIRELRIEHRWTQREMAEKLGWRIQALSNLEIHAGEGIRLSTLRALTEVLGCSVDSLLEVSA